MRRWYSIARATAIEILSEPLSLLVLISAVALAVLTPAFHYHQFGEATRMARDAGLSALFSGGTVLAVFATIRAFRREVESGTLEMALARPVSRAEFFLAKTLGAATALLVFALTLLLVTSTVVHGAAVGGIVAAKNGDVARLWGPSVAAGVSVVALPLVIAAVLNRFARFRFCLWAFFLAFALALLSQALQLVARIGSFPFLKLFPVALLITLFSLFMLVVAAAFSVRLRANAAASSSALAFLASLPFVGNYYLAESLAHGNSADWLQVGMSAVAIVPAIVAFLVVGSGWRWSSSK